MDGEGAQVKEVGMEGKESKSDIGKDTSLT